jgi:hypothetical protein
MPIFYSFETNYLFFFFLCDWFAMQPVSGGATLLAGASATLPRTSPNQANPTASQQYATLPLHASVPKTEASQSYTAVKMENAPSATSQPSIPAYASALDDSVTHSVQSSAPTAKYATPHTQSTVINQGSYPAAVPVTVHYSVQVPTYGIPPLPQTAPPPRPASVSFPSHSHTGLFPSSIPPLPQTVPPPPPNVSFPSQSHTGHFRSSITPLPQAAAPPPPNVSFYSRPDSSHTGHFTPSIPVPNYSTYATQTNAANDGNPLNGLPVGYSAAGSIPVPPSSTNFSLTEGTAPPQSYGLYSQYSILPSSTTISSAEGDIPQQSHTPYSQYSTLPTSTTTLSTEQTVPTQSHTPYSQYSTLPTSTTTSYSETTVLPQAQSLYSQYSALPPATSTSFSDEAIPPASQSLYSQYSTLSLSATTHDDADIYSSTDDLLDPIARSRKPNARLSGRKIDPMEVGS